MCNIFLLGIQKRFLVTDEYKARMWCSEWKWQHKSTFTPASNISPIRYITYLYRNISLKPVQSSVDSGSTLYFPHDHINIKFQCHSPFVHQSCSVSFLPLSFDCPPTCTPALRHLISFGLYTSTKTSSISPPAASDSYCLTYVQYKGAHTWSAVKQLVEVLGWVQR